MHAPAVLVFQHIECEPPGIYEDVLRERGADLHRVELDEGEPLPDRPKDYAAVITMGGPMGAYDGDRHPWLLAEQEFLRDAVEGGVPVLGACLGAQQLAAALGAQVWRAAEPEVGVLDVHLTAEGRRDPVLGALPARFPTLQWHGDTFAVPPGATRLASSPAFPHQAFRAGSSYGVQFHLEVTEGLAREWAAVPAYAAALEAALGPGAFDRLLADFSAVQEGMQAHARRMFTAWWEGTVEPARARARR